jgi:hypothetical protein
MAVQPPDATSTSVPSPRRRSIGTPSTSFNAALEMARISKPGPAERRQVCLVAQPSIAFQILVGQRAVNGHTAHAESLRNGGCGFSASVHPLSQSHFRLVQHLWATRYREYRDRYRDMATSLGFDGHIAWSEAMP